MIPNGSRIDIALAYMVLIHHDFGDGPRVAWNYGKVIAPFHMDMVDQLPDYTRDFIRIQIVESLGWKRTDPRKGGPVRPYWQPPVPLAPGELVQEEKWGPVYWIENLPLFDEDLNLMHEVEKKLGHEHWQAYSLRLADAVKNACWDARDVAEQRGDENHTSVPLWMSFPAWHATAFQRAEAYVRTLNLKTASDACFAEVVE